MARYGIYRLDLETGEVELIWSTEFRIAALALDPAGDRFAFSCRIGGTELRNEEICAVNRDGTGYRRLTRNSHIDTYPVWSPDGTQILYLAMDDMTLDIWVMSDDGSGQHILFDSGIHDADPSWVGDRIAFTKASQVWLMDSSGANVQQLTDPPRAGEWGNAVLPFGDYDPRISPDGSRIVFERLVDDQTSHGNYDLFMVSTDGSGEARLTANGWTQGLAQWSDDGEQLVYSVTAIETEGKYEIWTMNADGTGSRSITPDYFPDAFLCHCPLFAHESGDVYFIGEWWEE